VLWRRVLWRRVLWRRDGLGRTRGLLGRRLGRWILAGIRCGSPSAPAFALLAIALALLCGAFLRRL
jgi:hypothetical protein